jgi:hypothetical protein
MKSIRFLVLGALALLATSFAAPGAHAASGPLEVRPSQGPAGSSAILHAAGFTAGEDVRVYVDGKHVDTETADGGTAAGVVRMPKSTGVHRIVLRGVASARTAAGSFTTTAATDPARPAFLVSPRALGASGNTRWPYAAEYLVANFPADAAIEAVYPWSVPDGSGGCLFDGYYGFRVGRADAHGNFEGDDVWSFGCQSVITLGLSLPWGEGEAATVIAADALIQPAAGYTAARRVRAVPSVSVHDGPIFLLGTGFTPGGAVSLEEQWVPTPTPIGTAASDGSVVTREDVGRPPEYEQEYKLRQGGSYGAAAAWRQEGATIAPTAAAANDLVAPGATTTIVGAGLTPGSSVTLTLAGTATVKPNVAVAGEGTFQKTFTIPAGTAEGGHAIEVREGAVAKAHASLAVGTAASTFALPSVRIVEPDLGVVALQSGDEAPTRTIQVCNDGAEATFTLTDDSPNVSVGPAPGTIAAGACESATVTVHDGAPTPSPEEVTITAATTGASATARLERLVRTVTIEPIQTRALDLAWAAELSTRFEGETAPGAQVEILAIGYGEPVRSLGWSESADSSGRWTLTPFLPPRGSHYQFVAIPVELSLDDDRSRYPTANGVLYGSRFLSYFEGRVRNDMTTSRTVFRGAGEPYAGVEDVFVLDPRTTTDSFDGAGRLEVTDTDGDHPQDIRPDAAPREGGGLFDNGDIVVENESLVGYYAAPTRLARRYETTAGSRSVTVIDRFENTGFAPRTYEVAFVVNGGAQPVRHRFRLSDGTTWENPADGAILRDGAAVDDQGFVALRDEDGPAGHGVGFVAWQQAPDRVRLRPGSRDEVVLEHAITVPGQSFVELRHAVGAAPTDDAAFHAARGGADTTPPVLEVTSPPNTGLTTTSADITVSGTVSDALGTPAVNVAVVDAADNDVVLVSPEAATVNPDGTWSAAISLPDEDGHYYLRVIADDGNGNTTQPHFRSVVLRRKPVVSAVGHDEVTAHGAKVTATFNANDHDTTYAVEYGTTTAYGSEVAGATPVTGHADVVRSVELTGLEPATTYHYRVVATNSAGTTEGADRTFTTLAAKAPIVGGLTVSELGQTSVRLSGDVNPNTLPSTWWVEYGTTESLGTSTAPSAATTASGAVSTLLEGLTPGTRYHAQLVAQNDDGTARGAKVSFTTPSAPAVGALSVSELSHASARLGGTVDPRTHPATWWIEYGTDADALDQATAESAPVSAAGSVSAVLDGLSPETNYYARLVAENENGVTRGAVAAFATGAAPDDGDGDGGGGGGGDGDGGDGSGDGDSGGGDPAPGPLDPPPPFDPGPRVCATPGALGCGPPPPPDGPANPAPQLPTGTRLRDVLRKGLPLDFDLTGTRCEGGCPLTTEVLVDRRTAKRLRMAAARKLVVVGKRTVVFRDDVRVRVTVKLTKKARERLKRVKRVTLVVKTTLTDAAGRRAVAERRLTLKR